MRFDIIFAIVLIVALELNAKVEGRSHSNPKYGSALKSYKNISARPSLKKRRKPTSRKDTSFVDFYDDDSWNKKNGEEELFSSLEKIEKKRKKLKSSKKRKRKSSSRTIEGSNKVKSTTGAVPLTNNRPRMTKMSSSRGIEKMATSRSEEKRENKNASVPNSYQPASQSSFTTEQQVRKAQDLPQQHSVTRSTQQRRYADQMDAMLTYTTPWVIAFLKKCRKDALLAVPRDYLADGFNLVHLPPIIEKLGGQSSSEDDKSYPLYKAALRVILSTEDLGDSIPPTVQHAAEALYSLVHARYITSPSGLETAHRLLKHNKDVFGKCPNPSCCGMPLLPYGGSSEYSADRSIHAAQRYCYCCGNIWQHWDSKVDGSAWGPSFCHLYLLTFGKIIAVSHERRGMLPTNPNAIPSVFGFRVHSSALKRLYES